MGKLSVDKVAANIKKRTGVSDEKAKAAAKKFVRKSRSRRRGKKKGRR